MAAQTDNKTTTQTSTENNATTTEAPAELAPVTVVGEALGILNSLSEARQALHQIAGGTTLVSADEFKQGPTGNLEEVLAFVPGVYAQNRFGGAETRLSIRGSGISLDYAIKGVRLLRNGLPIMEADGYYHSQLIEPLTIRYVEVYRGANALQYGASSLGGAINFVTHTGYSAAPLLTRLEMGSNGFLHPQVASGNVLGNGWDYYASISGLYADGFREHSETDSTIFYGNLGYRHDADAMTRLHVSLADSSQTLPGALTRAQLEADPSQASGYFAAFGSENAFDRKRVDLQHTRNLGAKGQLNAGVFYEVQDIHHPLPFFVLEKDLTTYGASLRHEMLLGDTHHFVWGGLLMRGDNFDEYYAPLGGGQRGNLWNRQISDVTTAELFAQDTMPLADDLELIIGAQLALAKRRTEFDDLNPSSVNTVLEESYSGFSPKLGILWQATDNTQVFANISRSFEPPTLTDFNDTTFGIIDAQTATTLEAGTRGSSEHWRWELAVYHSQVQDEVLRAEVPPLPSGVFATANAENTVHAGVELGLEGRMPLNWLGGDALHLRLAYTYNHFRFEDNTSFGNNRLPGLPRNFGRLELIYQHASGFYIGPNLEAASSYYVDYANTLKAEGYTIIGLRTGYETESWSLFVEAANLTDEHYASNTGVINDAGGMDRAVFNPGRERSVFVGAEVKW